MAQKWDTLQNAAIGFRCAPLWGRGIFSKAKTALTHLSLPFSAPFNPAIVTHFPPQPWLRVQRWGKRVLPDRGGRH